MKLASEATAGLWVPLVSSLDALLARLESHSSEPGLAAQRQIALRLALQPYLEGGARALLSPLPQETELANLLLYADFYPQDGQLTLIEQLRDVITEHIPQEEREWLDPLKHSSLDLVEFLSVDESRSRRAMAVRVAHRIEVDRRRIQGHNARVTTHEVNGEQAGDLRMKEERVVRRALESLAQCPPGAPARPRRAGTRA